MTPWLDPEQYDRRRLAENCTTITVASACTGLIVQGAAGIGVAYLVTVLAVRWAINDARVDAS